MSTYAATHREGLGCSEIAAALGIDPRKSPVTLWAEKRGLVESGDGGDASTERGLGLECALIDYASARLGLDFEAQGVGYDVPIAKGRLLGSPDAMVLDRDGVAPWDAGVLVTGLECKTRQSARGWGEDSSNEIPIVERSQVDGYIALTGVPTWHVAVLFGMPFEFRLYRIERDDARCAKILAFVERWWQRHIVEGIAPAAVTPEDHSRRARLLAPKANGEVLTSSAREVVALLEERRDAEIERANAKAALEAAEDRWRKAGGQIEELIGSAAGIETPVGSAFLNSRTSRGRLVTKWPGGTNGE